MAKSELVYEFQGSRNLNTTPIDITGLQGDTYDYELITWFDAESLSSTIDLTFNNDTTANYRKYHMLGDGSSASASIGDSNTAINLLVRSFGYPSLSINTISGSSGDERYINSLSSFSAGSVDTRIYKTSSYWKDTVNEINSIQLTNSASVTSTCHILLYRTLKTASQSNWERVDELTWSAESTEKSFTVDGDRDKKFKVVWNADQNCRLEINNDAGSNYIRQYLQNNSGTISAGNTTGANIISNGHQSTYLINAETGQKRLVTTSSSRASAVQQTELAHWYTNTATNVTSLDLTPSASASGTAVLYRMKSGTETDGVLNWELVESVDVSGDFSAGHTFSGLTGDSEKLYRLEWLGSNTTSTQATMNFRLNADSGSNYDRQYLRARGSTVSAAASTLTSFQLSGNDDGEISTGTAYIYPKSGSARPSLLKWAASSTAVEEVWHQAQWWTNTASEITSILAFGSSTDTLTGKLKLWRLK